MANKTANVLARVEPETKRSDGTFKLWTGLEVREAKKRKGIDWLAAAAAVSVVVSAAVLLAAAFKLIDICGKETGDL